MLGHWLDGHSPATRRAYEGDARALLALASRSAP
jgi:hypothetical protein